MAMGHKYTWEECHANMHRLWLHHRRAPTKEEADAPPSRVGGGTYPSRFGTWRNALAAYVAYRNGDKAAWPMTGGKRGPKQGGMAHGRAFRAAAEVKRETAQGRVAIGVQLRYKVMLRDRFRCTLCGANPAADPNVVLHVDHVAPQAAGGRTSIENLRTLCAPCNVGKGTLRAEGEGGAESMVPSSLAQPSA